LVSHQARRRLVAREAPTIVEDRMSDKRKPKAQIKATKGLLPSLSHEKPTAANKKPCIVGFPVK